MSTNITMLPDERTPPCPKCGYTDTWVANRDPFGAGTGTCTQCRHSWPVAETVPTVGMGVTMGAGSDCYPYTVVAVSPSKKSFTIQGDNHAPDEHHERVYGGHQSYSYSLNPNGSTLTARRGKNGWVVNGRRIHLGSRRYYQDPHV